MPDDAVTVTKQSNKTNLFIEIPDHHSTMNMKVTEKSPGKPSRFRVKEQSSLEATLRGQACAQVWGECWRI